MAYAYSRYADPMFSIPKSAHCMRRAASDMPGSYFSTLRDFLGFSITATGRHETITEHFAARRGA